MVIIEGILDSIDPISKTLGHLDDYFEVLVGGFNYIIGLWLVGRRFVSLNNILIDHFCDFWLEM